MTQHLAPAILEKKGNVDDVEYHAYLHRFQQGFEKNLSTARQNGIARVFNTSLRGSHNGFNGLWQQYLAGFPEEQRAYHNCSACRRFVERYGHLVTLDEVGNATPLFFADEYTDDIHREAARNVRVRLGQARVTGVYVSTKDAWVLNNKTDNPIWHHYGIPRLPRDLIFPRSDKRAAEQLSQYNTQYRMMQQTLAEFPKELLSKTLTILLANPFQGTEKVVGVYQWLLALHERLEAHPGKRHNILWHAVAYAPAGFASFRSLAGATLLEDLRDGLEFEHAKRKFLAVMDPLKKSRPQTAPTRGNIQRAEEIVGELGIANSLKRRIARPDELRSIWKPAIVLPTPTDGGVFGHLKAKDDQAAQVLEAQTDEIVITWDKFRRTVLPIAEKIDIYVGHGLQSFSIFTTAVDAEAPPILQWDKEEARNPLATYNWMSSSPMGRTSGSPATQHGLSPLRFYPVTGISLAPPHQADENSHPNHLKQAVFLIEDACETKFDAGLGLFPDTLKSELNSVRRTIEAHSNAGNMKDVSPLPHAVGLQAPISPQARPLQVRVHANGQKLNYKIDRWD